MFHGRILIAGTVTPELAVADPTTVADSEKTNDANDPPCPPKKKKKGGQVVKAKRQKVPS